MTYCAPSRDSRHRKAQLFAQGVLEGRVWGLERKRGRRDSKKFWERRSTFTFKPCKLMFLKMIDCSCCFCVPCFLSGMEACCPLLLHEDRSSVAQPTKRAQAQLSVFNLLCFLMCKISSYENFPILLAMRCCDCCGDREEKEASHFACLWLVMMLMLVVGSPGRNPWSL